jgi:7-cyano-7-deazaguanine reductase
MIEFLPESPGDATRSDDLVAACRPRRMTVVGDFTARGGISTTVTASYERS